MNSPLIQSIEDLFQGAWDGVYPVLSTVWGTVTADPFAAVSMIALLAGLIWAIQACRI
jgi:hypothetical protein